MDVRISVVTEKNASTKKSLGRIFLLLGVLLVPLVDGNQHDYCDCKCSSRNVCDTISEMKNKIHSNLGFMMRWVNPLNEFRDWFYNKDQYMLDLLEGAIKPHIDRKLEELVADKIFSGNTASSTVQPNDHANSELDMKETIMNLTRKLQEVEKESEKTKDELADRINEVESESLQTRNELLLRINDAERSLKEKSELLDQLRETEQELKGELATVREQLEASSTVQPDAHENPELDMKETIMNLTRKLQEVEKESSKTKDELAARINEVESTSLQARTELLLRINESERSLKEKDELLDQLRETEQELKGELATVREELEKNLRKIQEFGSSLIAYQNATVDAIQKNISSSAENLTRNIYESRIRSLNDRVQELDEDKMRNLTKKVDELDTAVKDCTSSHSLSMLDERLRNLSKKTDVVVDNFTQELSPLLQELDKKIDVVEAAMDVSLRNRRYSIGEIWSHLKVQSLRRSLQWSYTPCPKSSTEWVEGPRVFCYLFETRKKLNWEEANRDCMTKGGALHSISSEETDFVKNLTRNLTDTIWTDKGKLSVNDRQFTWVDGKGCSYSNGTEKEPKIFGEIQSCFQQSTADWTSSEVSCDTELSYVCFAQKAKLLSYHNQTPEKICPNSTTDWVDLGQELCYLFVLKSRLNWYEANFDCQMKGGELASIHSAAEVELFRPHLERVREYLSIGLRRSPSDNDRFEWLDGSEFNYSNWGTDQPKYPSECGSLSYHSNKWAVFSCYALGGYICSALKIPVIRKLPYAPCPASSTEWVEGNGEWCYLFETQRKRSWEEANYDCMKNGGALVIIHSEEEKDFLYNHTRSMPETLWIGLRKHPFRNSYFEKVDGTGCRYSNWIENEPNDPATEWCVMIFSSSMIMKVADCNTEEAYICSARKAKLY